MTDTNEKVRPGYVAPLPVGVTPNPGTTLSWPMSYASTHSSSSERPPAVLSLHSTGTHYDPIRQRDTLQNAPPHTLVQQKDNYLAQKRKWDDGTFPMDASKSTPRDPARAESPSNRYEPQQIVTPTNSLQSGKRNHVCDICGATFTRQHNLKSHFLTHTSSKKEFICAECGSEFRRSHDLKRHQKLHTGEKPFACDICGRRFARADALGRHTKSSGESAEGCVNSRKTSSDHGSSHPQGPSDILPVVSVGRSEHFSTMVEPSLYASDKSVGAQSTSMPLLETSDPNRDAMLQIHKNETSPERHPVLPPLHTAFGLENERFPQHIPPSGLLNTSRFGISSSFDLRPPSTHPISFDRGSLSETQAHASSTKSGAEALSAHSTVPLLRYQKLESEHQAAMEHIRRLQAGAGEASARDTENHGRDQ